MRSVRRVVHLVVRFVTSLFARTPGERDMEWVRATLGGPEFAIWATMGRADRAESVAVARRAEAVGVRAVGVAAALVHDVGKQRSGLSTLARALVTALDALAPRRLAAASSRSRAARAAQQYLDHAELGAQSLAEALQGIHQLVPMEQRGVAPRSLQLGKARIELLLQGGEFSLKIRNQLGDVGGHRIGGDRFKLRQPLPPKDFGLAARRSLGAEIGRAHV